MVREILKIRTDNGLGNNNPSFKNIELTEYSAKFSRMGMPELTASFMWEASLDDEWTGKEYIVLRGERFYIRDTPDSTKSNTDARWKHDITFTSEFAEILGNIYFEDYVPDSNLGITVQTANKPCSNSSKFTFYGTIAEFIDRLNCSFLKAGIGDSILNIKTSLTTQDMPVGDGFCVMLDPYGAGGQYDPVKSYEFSFEDKTLWEAITEGFNITEIPFERRGRRIIFGAQPVTISHAFEYGHDNNLLSVAHKNAKAKVINRITMLGSSENIPYYYPNETEYGHISLVADSENNILTSSMISAKGYTRLFANVREGDWVRLRKEATSAATVTVDNSKFHTGFFHIEDLSLSYPNQVHTYPYSTQNNNENIFYVRTTFSISKTEEAEFTGLQGCVWSVNQGKANIGNLVPAVDIVTLYRTGALGSRTDMMGQISRNPDGTYSLGKLMAGDYEITLAIPFKRYYPEDMFFIVRSVNIKAVAKEGYYWECKGKKYTSLSKLGISLSVGVSDSMIGDGFKWTASGRMPFQTNLVPPKYRNTLGAERFYNALNAPYAEEYAQAHPDAYVDPDTKNPYTFINPYIAGHPSEHIHTNDEIKPTIEGVVNADGQLFGEIADIAFDADDNDSLKSDSTEDKDKNDTLKYEHSFFYIRLNIFNGTYGFDLFSHAIQTDAMTIQMLDGSCNGCKFKIQAAKFTDSEGFETYKNPVVVKDGKAVGVVSEDGIKESDLDPTQQNTQTHSIWICVQKDAETFGVIMPNHTNLFLPEVGDKFNIINIELPEGYIRAAEKRLEEDGMRFMSDNNEEKFTFDIQASRIFFANNPEVLAQLDEYSKIKVVYNGQTYEQYVNQLTIDCKDNEALPNIGIGLTDELAVGQSFVEKVAERASSLISNAYSMGGALGSGGGGLSTRLADQRYLNKNEADRSKGLIASDVGFEVGEFVSGASGGLFYRDPETGQTYIEVDKIKARMKAIFAELEVAKEQSIGGKFDITPGGGIDLSFVEELADSYRCYFKAKDEDKGADCRFVVGDQARCQESNISAGTTQNASNRYYWRLVTAVNNTESYIELSKTDCDTGSDEPIAGDTIVQLGNRNDAERQSAIVLSTVDAFAPCVTLYNGIDHYSLDGKSMVEYGVDKTQDPPEPFFNCYGRFFFGPKGGNSYLKFEPSVDRLIFSGELINISTLNGKDIDQYIKDLVPPVTQEDIEGYVNAIVDPQIEGIQNQIDGVIESFFGFGAPTLDNYPANEWTTDEERKAHNRDTYTDKTEYVDDETTPTAGHSWRWQYTSATDYGWVKISDSDATRALLDAAKAQDTADGKRRTFDTVPTPPYDKGDLWVNATYPANTTKDTRDPSQGKYFNDILRCGTEKAEGQSFSIDDWGLASNYTDDSALDTFIAQYTPEIANIKTQLDGKAETWYQPTDPSLSWTTDKHLEHKGDLWYNTTDGTTWYWDGSQWKQQDVPDSVFDKIDGKADIFVSQPTSGYHKNDLWFLESDYTLLDGLHKAGTLAVALNDMGADGWKASDWAKKDRYTDDTLAQSAKDEIAGYAYIKEALKGNTVINGGLVLSSLIKLGIWTGEGEKATLSKVYAGVNGVRKTDKSPFLWGGGDMVDKYYDANGNARTTALESGFAASLLRMDGSAYFAKGNIGFNADGSGWLGGEDKIKFGADGSMVFGSGIKINLNTGEKGLKETIESFANILTYFIPEDSLGNTVAWGGNVARIRVTKGFYSDGFISARGANPDGSTGGATQLRMLDDVLIGSNLTTGQVLVFNGTKWVNQAISTGLNTTELANYLTTNDYAKKSDIPSLTGYATETWVEGKGYLTDYTIHALTLQAGAFSAKTYNPKSAAQTVNIPTTTSHISEGTNKYFTDARAQAALADTVSGLNTAIGEKLPTATFDTFKSGYDTWKATVDAFMTMFTLEGSGANRKIKANFGLYSESFISARGANTSGGGSGAGLIQQVYGWNSLGGSFNNTTLTDTFNAYTINRIYSDLTSRINNLPTTSVNPYALTIQKNGTTLGSYDGSAAKTVNITVGWSDTASGRPSWIGSSKPSYNFSEIGSKPTTLGGYGITDAVAAVDGKGLSSNDFTDTLLDKLDGIEDGANKYVHPTNGANTTISAANGKVLSAITVNSLGHVTSVSSKTLAAADIPTLAISKISGLQTALDAKVSKAGDTMTGLLTMNAGAKVVSGQKLVIGDCEITWDATNGGLKFSKGIYSESYVSARGSNTSGGSSSGGGTSYNRLDNWSDYATGKEGYVLSAGLGYDLYSNKADKSSLANYVDKTSAQEISGVKTFNSEIYAKGGLSLLRAPVGSANIMGCIGFNRDSSNGNIPNTNYTAFQFTQKADVLYLEIFNSKNNPYLSIGCKVSASSFIKSGGTSSQALMADGSVRTVNLLSTVTNLGWADTSGQVATVNTLAYWNGRYSESNSNLQYCDRGRFGTMAVANAADYLPLTGGTLTGSNSVLNIDSTTTDSWIYFKTSSTRRAAVGYYQGLAFVSNEATYARIGVNDAGVPQYWGGNSSSTAQTLWHSGNDGHNSGLDADLLDGWHATGQAGNAIKKSGYIASPTAGLSSYWGKLATINVGSNDNKNIALYLHSTHGNLYGILDIGIRINSGNESYTLRLLTGNIPTDRIRLYRASSSPRVFELWINVMAQWGVMNGMVFSCTDKAGTETGEWVTMHATSFTTVQSPTLPTYITPSYLGLSNNVASATKLANTRTIWGQNFNGEGNVSGNLSSVSSIYMNRYLFMTWDTTKGAYLNVNDSGNLNFCAHENYSWIRTNVTITHGGNVGIGTTNPQNKLDVNGGINCSAVNASSSVYTRFFFMKNPNFAKGFYFESDGSGTLWIGKHENYGGTGAALTIAQDNFVTINGTLKATTGMYSDGYVSARGQNTSSDERLKFLQNHFKMDVRKIANAPSWNFKWKSDGKEDVGSLAQYWERINPLLTPKMSDGSLTLQYGKAALLGLISVAKKVVSHEDEIKQLKEEVKRLNKRIKMLEKH